MESVVKKHEYCFQKEHLAVGMLSGGVWQNDDIPDYKRDGKNVRFKSGFDEHIKRDGTSHFAPEANRYVVYCNWTCPWSHRVLLARQLKGLSDVIDVVLLDPVMGPESWWFGLSGEYYDPEINATHLHQLYSESDSKFTGRVSIPILWDRELKTIVNNNSGAIARMLNDEFNHVAKNPQANFSPSEIRAEVDDLNSYIGDRVMDGVYRCLLAASQEDFDHAFKQLFKALDFLDQKLDSTRYLLGSDPTEPDWRLFACLVRFDAIYYGLYRCNWKRIIDYQNLWDYTRDLFQYKDARRTVDLDAMKRGYYGIVTPGSFIPQGPELDFLAPHGRNF